MAKIIFGMVLAFTIMFFILLYISDKKQMQHSVLRNFPILGRVRYFLEKIGVELRQYLFDADNEAKPFSRVNFNSIVFPAKYLHSIISWGSKRDFEKDGFYINNSLVPKLNEELRIDNSLTVHTKKYEIVEETLFSRKEKMVDCETKPYLLADEDAIVIGPNCKYPFVTKSFVGMSGMSYGALGENAITALSEGIANAKAWMNTGEGGISPYHLKGNADLIFQIGPGLFGVRDEDGSFSWEKLLEKSQIPQVKAIELKLGQGAKIKGGMVPAEKVSEQIAEIRGVKPYTAINSPNRFKEFHDLPSLFDFIEKIREVTGKPVGIKIVIGSKQQAEELAKYMKESGKGPDFITCDGGEGGSGSAPEFMADSIGLPIKSALVLLNESLIKYGVRERVKIIASGKLFTADRIAIALSLGADMVSIARGFMITVGCIGAQRCANNDCPVGVATTDPELQKALVIDEKKYRVANYILTLRSNVFSIAAACGIVSPREFNPSHVVYKDSYGRVYSYEELYKK